MNVEDAYISRVIAALPQDRHLRQQVTMELRSHIAERVEHGFPVDEALRQLGDPVVLAESYLAAVPLVSAPFLARGAARTIDFLAFVAIVGPIVCLLWRVIPFQLVVVAIVVFIVAGCFYPLLAEYWFGKTLGKHLLGLRVVRESGGRISFGQSVVRQLPLFLQVFWIDVMFALFTEKHQRAFELLSMTGVVVVRLGVGGRGG
jgi:uncharacterized RDD family membrane protein YckC